MTVRATSSLLNVPVLFFTGIGEFSKVGDTVGLRTGQASLIPLFGLNNLLHHPFKVEGLVSLNDV